MRTDNSFIRPSILDKLAECGHYRSEPDAGPAAERGTRIDVLFRSLIATSGMPMPDDADPEEWENAQWAVRRARELSDGSPIDATEDGCAVEVAGLLPRLITGTMDALCAGQLWSADLKSGQARSYEAQQALYAMGCMDRFFCDEWTVFILYCDLRSVHTYRYTYESAAEVVNNALSRWRGGEQPRVNDYCGWCANRLTCEARRESLGHWLAPTGLDADPGLVLANVASPKLVAFVNLYRAMESFDYEAREILKARRLAGEEIPGVKTIAKRGTRRVDAVHLIDPIQAGTVDLGEALLAIGQLTESKVRKLWPAVPDDLIFEAPGRVELHVSQPNKPTTKPKQLTKH